MIESKSPSALNIKNLSNFIDKIDLEVKISNKDIVLIKLLMMKETIQNPQF